MKSNTHSHSLAHSSFTGYFTNTKNQRLTNTSFHIFHCKRKCLINFYTWFSRMTRVYALHCIIIYRMQCDLNRMSEWNQLVMYQYLFIGFHYVDHESQVTSAPVLRIHIVEIYFSFFTAVVIVVIVLKISIQLNASIEIIDLIYNYFSLTKIAFYSNYTKKNHCQAQTWARLRWIPIHVWMMNNERIRLCFLGVKFNVVTNDLNVFKRIKNRLVVVSPHWLLFAFYVCIWLYSLFHLLSRLHSSGKKGTHQNCGDMNKNWHI